jgi:hypothetical protein
MKNEKINKKLLITISQESENDELFNILNGTSKLPFNLPKHVVFPGGKKEFARRSRMLMLAGLDFLKEKYPNLEVNEIKNDVKLVNSKNEYVEVNKEIATF